jgi:protoheme IX farnesyltransferase
MLPVRDESGARVAVWSLINSVILVAVSLLPVALHLATLGYGTVAALCGGVFLWRAVVFLKPEGRDAAAKKLFFASIIYLPIVLGALVIDRVFLV